MLRRLSSSIALTKTIAVILVAAILLPVSVGSFLFWAYSTDHPPFCSGYPPGGNCPGTYSYNFTITVNYTGPWSLEYYGYHTAGYVFQEGAPGNYLGGSRNGTGSASIGVTLSGPNNNGLTLCALATKLDSSNNTLTLAIIGQNSTSLPYGSAYTCNGVVP